MLKRLIFPCLMFPTSQYQFFVKLFQSISDLIPYKQSFAFQHYSTKEESQVEYKAAFVNFLFVFLKAIKCT
jgi:hypothetical protein